MSEEHIPIPEGWLDPQFRGGGGPEFDPVSMAYPDLMPPGGPAIGPGMKPAGVAGMVRAGEMAAPIPAPMASPRELVAAGYGGGPTLYRRPTGSSPDGPVIHASDAWMVNLNTGFGGQGFMAGQEWSPGDEVDEPTEEPPLPVPLGDPAFPQLDPPIVHVAPAAEPPPLSEPTLSSAIELPPEAEAVNTPLLKRISLRWLYNYLLWLRKKYKERHDALRNKEKLIDALLENWELQVGVYHEVLRKSEPIDEHLASTLFWIMHVTSNKIFGSGMKKGPIAPFTANDIAAIKTLLQARATKEEARAALEALLAGEKRENNLAYWGNEDRIREVARRLGK